MKKHVFIFAILLVTLVAVPAVFAGGNQETSEEAFLDRLETALENTEFTESEVQAIIEASGEFSWEPAEGADAQVVARALAYADRENADLEPGQQAELALELAQNSVRLEEENYEESVVAQATLEAVRTMLGQIEEWKSGDQTENLGEIVRNTVSNEARNAAKRQASEQKKAADAGEEKAASAVEDSPAGGSASATSNADR
ncbi:MAG: hypothetical protein U5P10_12430 [Spirochaetia bacterium]|nr:hypothetical protein [Spirochaetia bacterium]